MIKFACEDGQLCTDDDRIRDDRIRDLSWTSHRFGETRVVNKFCALANENKGGWLTGWLAGI